MRPWQAGSILLFRIFSSDAEKTLLFISQITTEKKTDIEKQTYQYHAINLFHHCFDEYKKNKVSTSGLNIFLTVICKISNVFFYFVTSYVKHIHETKM